MAFINYDYLVEFVVTDLDRLKKLKSMREELDYENAKERHLFLRKFRNLVIGWKDHLPDLRDIFMPEEMDWMLTKSVDIDEFPEASDQTVIIDFVVRTGYQDEPNLDKEGNPLLRRNTPVHYIFRNLNFYMDNGITLIQELFKIYDYFYVNYVSDDDWTHFHVASALGFDDVVQNFLAFGHDPNQPGIFFNCTPLLFWAIEGDHKKIVQLLLEYGADPNLSGKDGLTPLHSILREDYDDKLRLEMFEILVKDCHLKHLPDNLGRTPLQLALLNRVPEMIDPLLDHGADLSSFVFPSEEQFNESIKNLKDYKVWDRLEAAGSTLAAVERLENRGYNLRPRDALRIKTFLEVVLQFRESENDESWRYDEAFEAEAKMLLVKQGDSSYTLHDLTRFPFKEPETPLTYEDYIDLAHDEIFDNMPENIVDACMAYLFERMSDGFYTQWGFRWS